MTKRRVIVGSAVALVVAVSWPAARQMLRHTVAQHTHIRFGRTHATPVVAVRQEVPAPAASEAPDLRFASRPLAGVAGGPLGPTMLDGSAFLPPTPAGGQPAVSAEAAGLDRTAEPNAVTPAASSDLSGDLAGARQAMLHYHDSDLAGGDEFARPLGGVLKTALDWAAIRLDSHEAGLPRLQGFLAAHAGWPLQPWIERRIEEARAQNRDPAAILTLFATEAPRTIPGRLSLARARVATGNAAGAAALVQAVWRGEDLTAPEEASILREFGTLLRKEDHKARADRLLYKDGAPTAAMRAAALAGPDILALARARASTLSDAALAAVPKALQADPGLLFSRIQRARRGGRIEEAAALLATAPRDAAALVDGDAWWVERRLVARKLLDAGNPALAYAVAAAAAPDTPAMKIEAAFHAGWIALRFLGNPALAAPHFAAVSGLAETPISNARGAYWQARAAEAQGLAAEAARLYAAAADWPTTFYGQLAAAKAGHGPVGLRQPAVPTVGEARNEAVRAAEVLFALGERDMALALALAIAKTEPDAAQVAALVAAVQATGDARATLMVGKAGTQRGMPVDEAAFPTFGVPGYQPIEPSADRATVLAIARQESEFDPRSVSSAGAMGLMQLITSTARKTAQDAGVGFDQGRLLSDAAFNARIGAAHLGKLLNDLDGSYILTFAAYNAGARKVHDWIAAYGDPRKPGVDPVDWIERIPFTETRNYVQRVFENLQIYRAQFGMPTAALTPTAATGKGT